MSFKSRAGHKYLQSTFEYSTNRIAIVFFKLTQPIGWFAVALHILFTSPILKGNPVLAIVISFEKWKIFVYFRLHSSINMPGYWLPAFRCPRFTRPIRVWISVANLKISIYQEKALYYWSAKMSRFRGNCIKHDFFSTIFEIHHTRW